MAALTGNAINTSYEGILKTLDNAAIGGTAKGITDGAGNAINMEILTGQINFPSGTVDFTGATVIGAGGAAGLASGTGTNSMESQVGATDGNAQGDSSIAIGQGATISATAGNSIAIGTDTASNGGFSNALGVYTEAGGNYATALGSLCNASASNTLAIGKQASATFDKAISIGTEVTSGGTESIVIGVSSTTTSYRAISIGQGNVTGTNSTTVGQYARTGNSSIAMGDNANNIYTGKNNAVSLGAIANAETNSVAVGHATRALGQNSVAIGKSSESNAYGAVALGDGVIAATADTLSVKLLQIQNYATMNFADDTAAATAGIPLGGVYHTSGALKIRIA